MNQPQSLSELVELAIRHRDTSGLGLSQLAAKNGHHLTATTINQIRQGLYKSKPREATIRAIAWLAGVSDEVAFTAAGQPVPGPPFAEELPPGVDNLPPKARKAVIEMLRVLVDMNQDAEDASDKRHAPPPAERVLDPRTGGYFRKGSIQEELQRNRDASEDQGSGDASFGQKTELPRAADYPDNNIPLPEDYLELAAHSPVDSTGVREDEAGRERGEASQEDGA